MKVKLKKKRILCPDCKIGAETLKIDESSSVCPYFSCYDGYKCAYFVPLDENKVKEKFKGILRKLSDVVKRH